MVLPIKLFRYFDNEALHQRAVHRHLSARARRSVMLQTVQLDDARGHPLTLIVICRNALPQQHLALV